MKKLVIIFAILVSVSVQAQQVKSSHLDSLIWKEINAYRSSLGIEQVKKFNNGELRKKSYQWTDLNASLPEIDHTPKIENSGFSTECIYMFKVSGTSVSTKYNLETMTESQLQEIAKMVVQAWINSNNHNFRIRSKVVGESTITSIMEFSKDSFRITVAYHALDKNELTH